MLPGCVTLAEATADVLLRFVENGGLLVAVGGLPEFATGHDVETVERLRGLFESGKAKAVATAGELPEALAGLGRRVDAPVPTLHRRIDGHDVLFVPATASRASDVHYENIWWNIDYSFDAGRYERNMKVRVQGAKGVPQLWNPLDGTRRRLEARTVGDVVEVDIPFDESPAALVVWGEEVDGAKAGTRSGGESDGRDNDGIPAGPYAPTIVATLDTWQAQVEPTLDNRYGDFDRPAHAGAPPLQTWRFEHRVEGAAVQGGDGEHWQAVEATFGPYGLWLGPLPAEQLPEPARGVDELRAHNGWQLARYSLTRGIAHDRVHNWTLGPKGHVPYEFLDFGPVYPGQAVRFRTRVVMPEEQAGTPAVQELHLALAAGAAKRLWVNGELVGDGPAGYLWLQPVRLRAGANLIEWELAPEEALYLRAMWALVRAPGRFVRPEWMTTLDAPVQDTLVRFTGSFDVPFAPREGTLHTGTAYGCRVVVNEVEVGRQGGFDPYGFQMRVYRHTSTAFRQGANTVTLEVHDPGQLVEALADVRVVGPHGEEAVLTSGAHWQVQRGEGPATATALRRFQNMSWNKSEVGVSLDPQAMDIWRRPHPLPGTDWIEDTASDDTVLPAVPDAYGRQGRVEWLRWALPPGARTMRLPVNGTARLWVDDVEVTIREGTQGLEAIIPASEVERRVARLRVEPTGGHSEGGLLAGPVTYTVEAGPIGLGPWAEYGLASYSGGVRYRSTFSLDAATDRHVVLDLGQVRGTVEVWVNGQAMGARIWAPYRFDITAAVQEGANRVEVLILNTLAPYLRSTSPTNYVFGQQEMSGLMGPVRVVRG